MRVIVLGSGAIGGVIAGHLARTRTQVVLIGRSEHITSINENGLRLTTPDGVHVLTVPAFTAISDVGIRQDDVIFLTVKSQDTEAAMRDLKKATRDIPVFCFQNGVTNEKVAHKYFPSVYGVMVRLDAEYITPGEVIARRDPPGWFVIGPYPAAQPDERAEEAAELLRKAGFFVRVTRDAIPYKWGKLMLNLANAVGAITDAPDNENKAVIAAAKKEAMTMFAAAGINWISAEQLAATWPEITEKPRGTINMAEHSSTWQSLTRRTGSIETEYLNGEIVRLAKKARQRTPVNEALLRISQEMCAKGELPGKYSPAQLRTAVGLK